MSNAEDFPFPTSHPLRPARRAQSVCVYCGSQPGADPAHLETARQLGTALAENGIELVYGGGSVGLMGALADAALDAGGRVTGIIPQFLVDLEIGHKGLHRHITTQSMHERKREMIGLSDAFVVLAGGLGTLDELAEAITWRQLGLHNKPIYLLGSNAYWQPFLGLLDHFIAQGFAQPTARQLAAPISGLSELIGHLTLS